MSSLAPPHKAQSCPLCGGPETEEHRPFCSRRCRDRDLLNWLGDAYRVPGPPAASEDFGSAEDGLDSQ
jgi:endogenous inhibitor of DNA gyrase (YacG/DUF329 family)